MHHFGRTVFLSAALFCAAGSAAEQVRLRVGMFVDNGSRNNGTLFWAQIFHRSPEVELTLLDGKDVRDGKLKGLDLLMIPGGGSDLQCQALGDAGLAEIRRFVAEGGAYLGVCAGCYCALDMPGRLAFIPYTVVKDGKGGEAALAMELSDRGGEVLGVPAGKYLVRYAHGPIMRPKARSKAPAGAEVLGVYRASVSPAGVKGKNFFGAPALLCGAYGKGKVVVTSFHPESRQGSMKLALGCVYAATGVKINPVVPVKKHRPIRVGYYSPPIIGARCIEEVFALEKEAAIDLHFVNPDDMDTGALEHLDALIFSAGVEKIYKNGMTPSRVEMIRAFLARGGAVFVSGNGAKYIPEHPNRRKLEVGEPWTPAVFAAAEKWK